MEKPARLFEFLNISQDIAGTTTSHVECLWKAKTWKDQTKWVLFVGIGHKESSMLRKKINKWNEYERK